MKLFFCFFSFFAICSTALPQTNAELPVLGFCIAAPSPSKLDEFVKFVETELVPAHFNLLILRVDYDYKYKSHPELSNEWGLSFDNVKTIVKACKKHNVKIVPHINLLGHQSWASQIARLLKTYPEFDETPHITLPEKYEWPNADGLYCKSYCPLHPDLHKILFELIDELTDVFETDSFHAGMDEVFYIGDSKCPRCNGRDKAELFAEEVTRLRNHLAQRNSRLYIWGDRLIDGKITGIGEWEADIQGNRFDSQRCVYLRLALRQCRAYSCIFCNEGTGRGYMSMEKTECGGYAAK